MAKLKPTKTPFVFLSISRKRETKLITPILKTQCKSCLNQNAIPLSGSSSLSDAANWLILEASDSNISSDAGVLVSSPATGWGLLELTRKDSTFSSKVADLVGMIWDDSTSAASLESLRGGCGLSLSEGWPLTAMPMVWYKWNISREVHSTLKDQPPVILPFLDLSNIAFVQFKTRCSVIFTVM